MTTTFERQVKGLLGTKLGMTQVWDENGKFVPVTVVKADSNVVTQLRNQDRDGYSAVQIGFGAIDPRKVTQPLAGHFEKAGVTPRRHLVELRTSDAAEYQLGQEVTGLTTAARPHIAPKALPGSPHVLQVPSRKRTRARVCRPEPARSRR